MDIIDYLYGKHYTQNITKKLQKISSYPAVFDPDIAGGFNVSFPDFPGCVTFGYNFEEAKEKAVEVLELWLEELNSQNQSIPMHVRRPIIDEVSVKLPDGFIIVRQKGSHLIFKHPQSAIMVPIPLHGKNKPILIGTFMAIIKQSKIPKDEFIV